MGLLTVGEMARLNHISQQTLRLYDRMGLLCPSQRGSENSYRYYDIRQSARLDMIQYMKSMGMNLRDIKEQLDQKDNGAICNVLRRKIHQIDQQLQELQYQKRAVERTIQSYERYENAPPDGTILMEHIEQRQMYCIDSQINIYEHGIEVYEKIMRDLKDSLVADSLPQIYFCNAGSILRRENLRTRRFISTEVFVFVDKEYAGEENITTVLGGNYLCIYCDRFEKEREYAGMLLDEAARRGFEICGDYLCEVLVELPLIESLHRGMFLRLQVPIKFR